MSKVLAADTATIDRPVRAQLAVAALTLAIVVFVSATGVIGSLVILWSTSNVCPSGEPSANCGHHAGNVAAAHAFAQLAILLAAFALALRKRSPAWRSVRLLVLPLVSVAVLLVARDWSGLF